MAKTDNSSLIQSPVSEKTGWVFLANSLGACLGFARDIVVAGSMGTSYMADAFVTAMLIPTIFNNLIVSGALSPAVIPVFSWYVSKNEKDAWRMANSVLVALMLVSLGIVLAGELAAPRLVMLLAPGFDIRTWSTAVKLVRVVLPAVLLSALSISLGALLNGLGEFQIPAFATLLPTALLILSFPLFYVYRSPVVLVVGFLVGALFQLVVVRREFVRSRIGRSKFDPAFSLRHEGVRDVTTLALPILLAQAFLQTKIIAERMFASTLGQGQVTVLTFGSRLAVFPMLTYVAAICITIFPFISQQAALRRFQEFEGSLRNGLVVSTMISLPIASLLIVFREPIVTLMFRRGSFGYNEVSAVGTVLALYSVGIAAAAANWILMRGFYALQDTFTPVVYSFSFLVLALICDWVLIGRMGVAGLALGSSLASFATMCLLVVLLKQKIGSFDTKELCRTLGKILLASTLMTVLAQCLFIVSKSTVNQFGVPYWSSLISILVGSIPSLVAYLAMLRSLGVNEVSSLQEIAVLMLSKCINQKNHTEN